MRTVIQEVSDASGIEAGGGPPTPVLLGEPRSMCQSTLEGYQSDEHRCPTCGREDFQSEHGVNIHHAKVHGEALTRVTLSCKQCGKEFDVPPSREDRGRRFCGVDCYRKFAKENFKGKNAPAYRGGDVTLKCKWCGDTYEKNPYAAKNSNFCSNECKWEWMSAERSGKDNPLYERAKLECSNCGSTFTDYPYKADQRRFCSTTCRAEYMTGENHPLWNGGQVRYYGPNWHPQRRATLKRDNHRCRVCSMTRPEHRDEFDEDLHVHHIVKIGWFKDHYDAPKWYELGNALDNLITLCEPHHDEWEGVPVAPQV